MSRGQAGARLSEQKITPEMIEAGASELLTYDDETEDPKEAVKRVLIAVFGVDAIAFHESPHPLP